MSKLFAKKLYIWIIFFLLVLIASAFLITYNAYTSLLANDFLEKQSFLSSQTAYALGNYLKSLEEQICLFSNRNGIPSKLQHHTDSVYELRFDSLDFWRIQVYSTSESVAIWGTNSNLKPFTGLSISDIRQILAQEPTAWHLVPIEINNSSQTYLSYLQTINLNDETVGYLVAWVEPSAIERLLSLYMIDYSTSATGLFSSYHAAVIEVGTYSYACSSNSISPELMEVVTEFPSLLNGKYIVRSNTGMQNIRLVLSGDASQLMDTFRFMQQILVCTYLLVMLLTGICLYFFARKIDSILKTLYNKLGIETNIGG